jgi:hypothetical protein
LDLNRADHGEVKLCGVPERFGGNLKLKVQKGALDARIHNEADGALNL